MKINKIILDNFTSYEGKYEFDFKPDKNFHVIGGENGNGKTSLLTAIIFCLFGSKKYNSDVVTNDYRDFVNATLNRNTKDNYFSVEIGFEHENDEFDITRKIEITDENKFIETETILKNGEVTDVCDFLEEYTKDIIELFFFNGETILDVIKNNNLEKFTTELINTSFNLNTFFILDRDLEKSINLTFKNASTVEFTSLQKKNNQLEKKINSERKEVEKIEKAINQNKLNIDKLEQEIKNKKMLNSKELIHFRSVEKRLKLEITKYKQELSEVLKKDLGNLLLLPLLNKTTEVLDATRNERVENLQKAYANIYSDDNTEFMSFQTEKDILNLTAKYREYDQEIILDLCRKISTKERKLNKIRQEISTTDEGLKQINYIDNIDHFNRENEELEDVKVNLNKQIELNVVKLKNQYDELSELKKEILKSQLEENAIKEKENLQNIVKEYISRKQDEIFSRVSKQMLHILNDELLRKRKLVDRIELKEYQLNLFLNNEKVDFSKFSSGEQQLLIVGLILSVIQESGNGIPLVLDTFIGRLDREHTKNVLDYLTRKIDNQTLILTTDKELAMDEYTLIKDFVGSTYTLTNDGYKTNLREGYFNYEN